MQVPVEPTSASVVPEGPVAGDALSAVEVTDLGDRIKVTIEIPLEDGDHPTKRRALAKAWETLASAISEMKANLPPMPAGAVPSRPAGKKRAKKKVGTRTGSGSWWQF